MKLSRYFAVPVALALVTGCGSTTSSRIEEKAAVYRMLTSDQQQRIVAGEIGNGFTPDMVYMALGKPSVVETVSDTGGAVEKWTYRNFYPSERVAQESLYRRPSPTSDSGTSGSVAALAGAGNVTDASSQGGYVESSGRATGSGGSGQADVSAATMEVWFRRGRVMKFQLTP